jgi:hypothetical protein
VASWSDGNPLEAVSTSGVTGINLFPDDAYGYVTGDYVRLFANALGGVWPTATGSGGGDGTVPEPAGLALFGGGIGLLGLVRRRRA